MWQTVFARSDGTETYYFNSQLFNKFMYVHRSFGTYSWSNHLTLPLRTNVRRSGVSPSSTPLCDPPLPIPFL